MYLIGLKIMKKHFKEKETILENDFFDLKKRLNRRRKMCKNKLLRNLDKKLKEDSINEVLFMLHKTADYCYEELNPVGVWDSETTGFIKESCFSLLNKLYGYNSKYERL